MVGQLLEQLAQPAPAKSDFFERRESSLLVAPMLLQGTLERPQSGQLIKRILGPPRESMEISADRVRIEREGERRRSFSLRRAPELAALAASFEALLGGDRALLEKHYQLRFQPDPPRWTLNLLPRDARLRKRVSALSLHGRDQQWRCFDLELSNGERSRMWLGEWAELAAAADDESARDALCLGERAAP